ncbi:MAG: retropepsin-like aspartic protease [Deltaproteobacteria bacterium]|nr:retropepsin-like aspartic protease [Deltaproteobacteria bacterium]
MADFRYELLKGVPFVSAQVEGKTLKFVGRFIVDTGAFMTIIRTPRIDAMGYSARDATKPFSTESVIGKETGYCLKIGAIEVFGKRFENLEVAALDLPPKYNIDGLIGMNLLNQFDWCLHPQRLVLSIK